MLLLGKKKKLKKATDYTPTTVTISGIGKGVYIIDNYPDIGGWLYEFLKTAPLQTCNINHADLHVRGSVGSGIQYLSSQIFSRSEINWFEKGSTTHPKLH